MLGALISFLGTFASLLFQPYENESQNVLESTCHFCIFILMILALAYKDTSYFENEFLDTLCVVIGFLCVLVPLLLGTILLNLHMMGCAQLVRVPEFFNISSSFSHHLDKYDDKEQQDRVSQNSVESVTDPIGDVIKQNQKLTGRIVKFGARLRLLTFSNRRRTEAKTHSKLEYKDLKQGARQKKSKIKAMHSIIATHETRNHHLVLCRQQAEVREEESAEMRPETPVHSLPKRIRRGVVGKMEHNTFLTTVDLHKIKTEEKRTVQILHDESSSSSSSSDDSDIDELP